VALPFMQDLYDATHENVALAIREGQEFVYIERILGSRAVHMLSQPGSRLPLHASAMGLVLLAHAPADITAAVLSQPMRCFTPHTVTDPRRLRRTLSCIRRDGYAVTDRQIEESRHLWPPRSATETIRSWRHLP